MLSLCIRRLLWFYSAQKLLTLISIELNRDWRFAMKKIAICIFTCGILLLTSCSGINEQSSPNSNKANNISATSPNGDNSQDSSIADYEVEYQLLTITGLEEYNDLINSNKLPEYFVTYDKLDKLGEFKSLVFTSNTQMDQYWQYMYSFEDGSNEDVYLTVIHNEQKAKSIGSKDNNNTSVKMADLNDNDVIYSDMTHLPSEENGIYKDGSISYKYISGSLLSISWKLGNTEFVLSSNSLLDNYPSDVDTIVSKLLYSDTHEDAIREIAAFVQLD